MHNVRGNPTMEMRKAMPPSHYYATDQALDRQQTLTDNQQMLNVRERRLVEARYALRELVERFGERWVCDTLEVHRVTVGRWLRGEVPMPKAASLALRFASGALEHGAWKDWAVGHDGRLRPPGWRDGWSPGEVMMLHFLHQQVARLKLENKMLDEKLRQLDTGAANDPVTDDIVASRTRL